MIQSNSQIDLMAVNAGFERAQPQEIIAWAAERFGDGVVMSSSFGADSAVLIHLANTARPGIRIVMVDTGYLFPETHRFMEELRHRFNLNVWTFRTANDPQAYLRQAGESDHTLRQDVDGCCAVNKNEPFARAFSQLQPQAWLRGIRRNQAQTRQSKPFVEWAARYNCYAISPLLNWTGREVHAYIKHHDLPYHPLRDQGYFSIGCNPLTCTRPVKPGEDPRSGRWAGQGKVECGINLNNSLDSAKL